MRRTAWLGCVVLALAAACGGKRERAAGRDGGAAAAPEGVRPAATRHDRGVAPVELAEGAPVVPPLPFLSVQAPLHHAKRVQRLEATYCSAEPAAAVATQLDAALVTAGWQVGGAPSSKQDAAKTRVVARKDRFRLSFTVASSVGGVCAGAGQTSVALVLFKVSGDG